MRVPGSTLPALLLGAASALAQVPSPSPTPPPGGDRPSLLTPDEVAASVRRVLPGAAVGGVRTGGTPCAEPEIRLERYQADVTVEGRPRTVYLDVRVSLCDPASPAGAPVRRRTERQVRTEKETGFTPDVVAWAREDLAKRLGIPVVDILVQLAGPVQWPDGSLGCDSPATSHTQAVVKGFVVKLKAGGATHSYHGAVGRPAFYCERPAVTPPTEPEARE